jgi:hypothetical protein
MSPLRRAISLILALSLTLVGASALGYLILFADHWRGWMVIGSGFVCTTGIIWIYSDFIDTTPNDERR